jgi:hypothetical protein
MRIADADGRSSRRSVRASGGGRRDCGQVDEEPCFGRGRLASEQALEHDPEVGLLLGRHLDAAPIAARLEAIERRPACNSLERSERPASEGGKRDLAARRPGGQASWRHTLGPRLTVQPAADRLDPGEYREGADEIVPNAREIGPHLGDLGWIDALCVVE